jgi:hypothetical protein
MIPPNTIADHWHVFPDEIDRENDEQYDDVRIRFDVLELSNRTYVIHSPETRHAVGETFLLKEDAMVEAKRLANEAFALHYK